MSELRVICPRCDKETPASACDKQGICVVCIISDAVAADKAEYQRQWSKRQRYLKAGLNIAPADKQCAKLATRLGNKVHARIGNLELAISIINAHLEEARNQVERGQARPRILIARPGDLLAKNNLAGAARGLLSA